MSEAKTPIRSIVTPSRLEYDFTPGAATTRFLRGMEAGRILGQRCPQCSKVYVPTRGSCPRCGVATEEEVEVTGKGTVTTFCIVRVPSENIDLKLPYTAAHILLDGADIPFFALIQECDAEEVRMGMRVEAVWAPKEEWGATFENIRYFRPIDEPDVPYDAFKEHL
jgi:uncharacterized OB-fold protein